MSIATTTTYQLQNGTLLQGGKYRIIKVLGSGGFGITYLAAHTMLDIYVAIKEFFPNGYCDRDSSSSHVTLGMRSNKELVKRLKAKFLTEARNIAKLKYTGIVRIQDVFKENGTAYYVMDYIDGVSIADIIKKNGKVDVATAVGWIDKVGKTLSFVHSKNINHLDIKPGNIMIDETGTPILIDFGLSKQYDEGGDETSTTPVGISHGYASPEQYRQGGVSSFSPRSDVYSLGATLYKCITGTTPLEPMDRIGAELEFPSHVSQNVASAIRKAMSLNKNERQGSVDEFCRDLHSTDTEDTFFPEIPVDTRPQPTPEPNPIPEPRPIPEPKPTPGSKKKKVLVILACCVAVAVICGLFYFILKNSEPAVSVKFYPTEVDGSINGHDYVDLGLPSGLKWATCNVGAASPEDYGEYYAWGDTSTKIIYDTLNCATYRKDIFWLRSNGYIDSTDNLTPAHDVARQKWDGSWRMPTKTEIQELIDNTTAEWSTRNGVNGRLVTSKRNGKTIFLPAAGCRYGNLLNYTGVNGRYWSVTPRETDSGAASSLYFHSGDFDWGWSIRSIGRSVRPVSE